MSAPDWLKPQFFYDMIFDPRSAFVIITLIAGVLLLISFAANYKGAVATTGWNNVAATGAIPAPLFQRSVQLPAETKKAEPVLAPKAVEPAAKPLLAPKVYKVEPKALEQKKTHSELVTEQECGHRARGQGAHQARCDV
jgi:hypothetical protein